MMIAELFAKLGIKPDTRSFDAADKMIGAVKTALIGLAAFAGTRFLGSMVTDTEALGSHINDLAQSSGVATDTLQELGYIASQNSSDMDAAAASLGKLQNNMAAAAKGGKEQAAAFRKLGVSIYDATGELRPVEDVFEDIAYGQKEITNEAEKGVAIFNVLGKSGRALIPTMNNIAEQGMAPLVQEARDLGAVMDQETIASLDEFGDQIGRGKTALTGLRNEAVAAILPQLKEMVGQFVEWVKVNKKVIAQKLTWLIKGLAFVLKGIARVVSFVVSAFEFLGDHIDLVAVAVIALTAAIAIFKLESIKAAIASGVAWFLSLLPIILLAAAIAAIILLVEDLYQWFTGGDSVLKDLWQSFKTWIGEKISKIWDDNVAFWKMIFGGFFDWCWDKIQWVLDKIEWVGHKIKSFMTMGPINDAVEALNEAEAKGLTGDARDEFVKQKLGTSNTVPTISPNTAGTTSTNTMGGNMIQLTMQGTFNGSPEENAKAITEQLNKTMEKLRRETAAAIGGVR